MLIRDDTLSGPVPAVSRRRKSKSNPEKEDAANGKQQQQIVTAVAAAAQGPLPYTDRIRTFRELLSNVDLWPGAGAGAGAGAGKASIPDAKREFEYLLQGYTHIRLTNLNNIREQLHANPRVTREIIEEQPDDMLQVSRSGCGRRHGEM